MEKRVMFIGVAVAFLVALNLNVNGVVGADPEILYDYLNVEPSKADGAFFTFTGLRGGAINGDKEHVGRKKASVTEFPALAGTGLSVEVLEFEPGTVNVPHSHPRGGEVLLVMEGSLTVGVVDSNGKLLKNELEKGDVFVFPKGLPHYQANFHNSNKAVALSSFGSANAGTVSLPQNVFASQIPDEILTKSFKVSLDTLQQIKAGLA